MIKVECKKLFNGNISIRDYTVLKALNQGKSILAIHLDQSMILTPFQLKTERISVQGPYDSSFGKTKYFLYLYKWEPTKQLKLSM